MECSGCGGSDYAVHICGAIFNGNYEDRSLRFVRKIGKYQIGIEKLDGKDCNEVFSLQ